MSKLFQVRWDLTDVIVVLFVVAVTIFGAYGVLEYVVGPAAFRLPPEVFLIGLGLFQAVILIVPIVGILIVKKGKWSFKEFGLAKKGILKGIPQALAAYLVYIAIAIFIMLIILYADLHIPGYQIQEPIIPAFKNSLAAMTIMGIITMIVAPLTEEVFFRGFVLQGLGNKFNPVLAALLTAGIFAMFHIQFGSFIPLFIIGLVLSVLFIHTKNLWACIWFHLINNAVAFLIQLMFACEMIPTDF